MDKDIINKVSSEYDKIWKKRNRSIDSKFLVSFIFQKITNTNKGYGITLMDLWDNYDTHNIKRSQAKIYATSSVCEAKQKMPKNIFLKINKELVLKYGEGVKEELLLGKHRIFAVDGKRLSLPREMVDCGYKKCNKDAYYPQGLISCICDINTHIVHDFCLEKNLNERICAS